MLEKVNAFVWGAPALVLILGAGLYFSIGTGFAQLRLLPRALRLFLAKLTQPESKGGVSPFQALCTALAATVGTGNLAGVAGAITIGGPGAVFWMWICGILGMVTKLAEATLAVRFRARNPNGDLVGGPMYMIRQGMGKKWQFLGYLYCFFGVAASLGVGNATQINTVVSSVENALANFGVDWGSFGRLAVGCLLAVVTFLLLLGGARRIGAVAERLVPVASVGYLLLCVWVIGRNASAVVPALQSILTGAFAPQAVTGGAVGSFFLALRTGVSRGVFTNESGMGTAAIAHAAAEVEHPVEQGLMGCVEVFLDTIVICTMTALVILCSGVPIPYGQDGGILLTTQAFSAVLGEWVSIPIALFLCCFAFATVLGWGLYGARCAEYLFGTGAWLPFAVMQGVTAVFSAVMQTHTVWLVSEILNGMMSIPNLIALLALSPVLFGLIKEYRGLPALCKIKNP